jgi:two-component system, LytTR family, sensor kinase
LWKRLTGIFDDNRIGHIRSMKIWKPDKWLLYHRWPWHVLFWLGYMIFRFWPYYITIHYAYPRVFLEYMLLSELIFVGVTYFTLWLYRKLFERRKYFPYFLSGTVSWIAYLCLRTGFQFWYLRHEEGFRNSNSFTDIFFNNIAVALGYFLFITTCKYFKDGYIRQYFEAEKKEQQLLAEVNNLKSQIAPHFLFNTLNNLYGLAVEKSDKLPDLMLRLSNLLRPVPENSPYRIAPLVLIVFAENAFKHSRLVKSGAVNISITASLVGDLFTFTLINNYNPETESSGDGIGLTNVKRRLEVLYPTHELTITRDELFFMITLQLPLTKAV